MSAARKIMAQNVPSNRVVTTFPQAYDLRATPYSKSNFHPRVKQACQERRTGCVGLKISKAVLVGDVAVGKTCLVNRFCHNVFDKDYKATIGVDFEVEKFSILSVPFTLQIWDTAGQERFKCIAASYYREANGSWDTAGQERFKSIASSYYRGANAVIVVFDLSDEGSLLSISRWMEDATKSASDPVKFVVGTKKDLVSPGACAAVEKRAKDIAESLEAEYWSVSSKSGENVHEFAVRAVSLIFDSAVLREIESSSAAPQKQIGSIKVGDRNNVYETKRRKLKADCCKT